MQENKLEIYSTTRAISILCSSQSQIPARSADVLNENEIDQTMISYMYNTTERKPLSPTLHLFPGKAEPEILKSPSVMNNPSL